MYSFRLCVASWFLLTALANIDEEILYTLQHLQKQVTDVKEENQLLQNIVTQLTKDVHDCTCSSLVPTSSPTLTIPTYDFPSCSQIPTGRYPQFVKLRDIEDNFYLCDTTTDGGNWTIVQRRFNGSEDFYRTREDYERGFGVVDGEFWMGLTHIYHLVRKKNYEIRIDINPPNSTVKYYASYRTFKLAHPAENYRITIDGYGGNAGNFLTNAVYSGLNINGSEFSTFDHDLSSTGQCASKSHSAWWYNSQADCTLANPNGKWGSPAPEGVFWGSLNVGYIDIKIRPRS